MPLQVLFWSSVPLILVVKDIPKNDDYGERGRQGGNSLRSLPKATAAVLVEG
jgi:hypothetical protein